MTKKPDKIRGIKGAPDLPAPDHVTWQGEPIEVFSCSGRSDHHELCNGNCSRALLEDDLAVALFNENSAWLRAGMTTTTNTTQDTFQMGILLDRIVQVLESAGIVDSDTFTRMVRLDMLAKLQEIRAELEPRIRRQRAQAAIALPQPPPLFGPNGQVIQ